MMGRVKKYHLSPAVPRQDAGEGVFLDGLMGDDVVFVGSLVRVAVRVRSYYGYLRLVSHQTEEDCRRGAYR
jgi:hypothetical protein